MKQKFDINIEKNIVELYLKGLNTVEIAKIYNTYNTSIRRILIRNNINLIPTAERLKIVKTNPFIDLNNNETQYWLGFICADGNVSLKRNKISLDSSELDEEHLRSYIKYLNFNVSLLKQYNKKYNLFECKVCFSSQEVKEYLISLGITPQKSKTLKVNFPITWDFLRGVIDGDGCIRKINKNGVSIQIVTASKNFKDQINNFLLDNTINHKINYRNNIYYIEILRKNDVFKCFNNLYQNATIYLKRKYVKFGSFVEKFTNENAAKSVKD